MDLLRVVDFDGALVRIGVLTESFIALLQKQLSYLVALPYWLLAKSVSNREVDRRIPLDTSPIPYRSKPVENGEDQRAHRRSPILATDNEQRVARGSAERQESIDSVPASDGSTGLSPQHRPERGVSKLGEEGFDHGGDGSRDPAVWSSVRKRAVFSSSRRFGWAFETTASSQTVFADRPTDITDYLKALRPQHWLKNLLVFVPIFALPHLYEPALFGKAFIVFIAFCFCASSGYLVNDLCDLAADRQHPTKRHRPFASGRLSLSFVLTMIPVLIVLSCVLGLLVAPLVVGVLLFYYALTLIYSLYVKRVILLDVIVLAGLHTLRIVAGVAVVTVWLSAWMFMFSVFLFLSLALAKRYVELVVMQDLHGDRAMARGYATRDAELLASNGTASGYMAVLALALYIASNTDKKLHGRHEIIWSLCPLLLYWIVYIWLMIHRRTVHDDPFVFAMRDRTSRILILLMTATALLAV
jgi:4-hydroxybenzoate polyprenyltransferase